MRRLLLLTLSFLFIAGAPGPARALSPEAAQALTRAAEWLRGHRAATRAALEAVDPLEPLSGEHDRVLRRRLAVLERLADRLGAEAPEVDDALFQAIEAVAQEAHGSFLSLRFSEDTVRPLPDPALAPWRLALAGASVLEALLPVLDPPRSEAAGDALASTARVLAATGTPLEVVLPLARRACVTGRCPVGATQGLVRDLVRLHGSIEAERAHAPERALSLVAAPPEGSGDLLILRRARLLWTLGRHAEAAHAWARLEAEGDPAAEAILAQVPDTRLVDQARRDPEVVALRSARDARRRARGAPVAGVEVVTPEGPRPIATLIADRPAVLAVWSWSCGPCVEELGELMALHDPWKDRVTFLGVNADEDASRARAFLAERGWTALPFLHLGSEQDLAALGVEVFPTTVFLGSLGQECHRTQGYQGPDALGRLVRLSASTPSGCPAAEAVEAARRGPEPGGSVEVDLTEP